MADYVEIPTSRAEHTYKENRQGTLTRCEKFKEYACKRARAEALRDAWMSKPHPEAANYEPWESWIYPAPEPWAHLSLVRIRYLTKFGWMQVHIPSVYGIIGVFRFSPGMVTIPAYTDANGQRMQGQDEDGYEWEVIEGPTQIRVPSGRFSIQKEAGGFFGSHNFEQCLSYYAGRISSGSFCGFPARTLMFLGAGILHPRGATIWRSRTDIGTMTIMSYEFDYLSIGWNTDCKARAWYDASITLANLDEDGAETGGYSQVGSRIYIAEEARKPYKTANMYSLPGLRG